MLYRLGKLISRLFRSGIAEICSIVLEDLITSAESYFTGRGIRLDAVNEDALGKNGENKNILKNDFDFDSRDRKATYHCIPTHKTNSQLP